MKFAVTLFNRWGVGKAEDDNGLLILLTAFGPLVQYDTVSAAKRFVQQAFSNPLSVEQFTVETNNLLSDLISRGGRKHI